MTLKKSSWSVEECSELVLVLGTFAVIGRAGSAWPRTTNSVALRSVRLEHCEILEIWGNAFVRLAVILGDFCHSPDNTLSFGCISILGNSQ